MKKAVNWALRTIGKRSLIRYDIIQGLRRLHEETGDEQVKAKALDLIQTERDPKYRKKYATVWRVPDRGRGAG